MTMSVSGNRRFGVGQSTGGVRTRPPVAGGASGRIATIVDRCRGKVKRDPPGAGVVRCGNPAAGIRCARLLEVRATAVKDPGTVIVKPNKAAVGGWSFAHDVKLD